MTVERRTLHLAERFQEENIRYVVLKGPVFAHWLFEDPASRIYGDSDFLIRPDHFDRAEELLGRLGFEPYWDIDFADKKPAAEKDWVRSADQAYVDLHRILQGTGKPPDAAWAALEPHMVPIVINQQKVVAFTKIANALHAVLHAAQHGRRSEKPLVDLSLVLERMPVGDWLEVASLAQSIEAMEWFASGLRLHPAGEEIAKSMALPRTVSVETALRYESAPWVAETLTWIEGLGSWRARALYVARSIFPSPRSMRTTTPGARKGTLALGRAYVRRWVWVMVNLPPAARAWWRARRTSRGIDPQP
jgi:hypothetical protein